MLPKCHLHGHVHSHADNCGASIPGACNCQLGLPTWSLTPGLVGHVSLSPFAEAEQVSFLLHAPTSCRSRIIQSGCQLHTSDSLACWERQPYLQSRVRANTPAEPEPRQKRTILDQYAAWCCHQFLIICNAIAVLRSTLPAHNIMSNTH